MMKFTTNHIKIPLEPKAVTRKYLLRVQKRFVYSESHSIYRRRIHVSYPGKGVCADPVNKDAILGRVGGGRPGQNRKRQFNSDTGDGKT
jgi:hypothetical protein